MKKMGEEEQKHIVHEAKAKNEKHIFALESDGGGFTPRGFSFKGTECPNDFSPVLDCLILTPYGVTEFSLGGAGADVEPLNEVNWCNGSGTNSGFPALF